MATSRAPGGIYYKSGIAVGAGLGVMGASLSARQNAPTAIPTPRARQLMALFGFNLRSFGRGSATGPELAAAISNAGAMGALALSGRTPDTAGSW